MSASFVLVEHKCSKLSTKRLVMKKCTEDRSLIKECVKRDGLFTIQIQLGIFRTKSNENAYYVLQFCIITVLCIFYHCFHICLEGPFSNGHQMTSGDENVNRLGTMFCESARGVDSYRLILVVENDGVRIAEMNPD